MIQCIILKKEEKKTFFTLLLLQQTSLQPHCKGFLLVFWLQRNMQLFNKMRSAQFLDQKLFFGKSSVWIPLGGNDLWFEVMIIMQRHSVHILLNILTVVNYKNKAYVRPSTAMTSIVYVLFSSLSKACTVFSSPEYFPMEKYFFVSPCREYLSRKINKYISARLVNSYMSCIIFFY